MAYVTFSNFKGGLDTRRSELTSQPGTLQQLQDCHVNPGAEIELRKAWLNASYTDVSASSGLLVIGLSYTIVAFVAGDDFTNVGGTNVTGNTFIATGTTPTTWTHASVLNSNRTFGLETVNGGLKVFGSAPDPGGWSNNVSYQQLVHPAVTDGATFNPAYHAMTAVNCSTSFGGYAWVAATFSDGNTFVYWNGVYVPAFRNGQVLNGWSSNNDIAAQLAAAITAGDLTGFVASVTGNVVTVYSAPGQSFTALASTTSAAGVITPTLVSNGITPTAGVAASAQFAVIAGSTGTLTTIYISAVNGGGGTNLLSAAIPWHTSAAQTAQDIAYNISTNPAFNGLWSAVATANVVSIYDNSVQGAAYNAYYLETIATGDFCVDNVVFNFSGVWSAVGPDNVASVLWGATTLTSAGVNYATTLLAFVQAIAANITAHSGGTYAAVAYPATTPLNSVNLAISRLDIKSGTAPAATATVTYTAAGTGVVLNASSGGSTTQANPITLTVSPNPVTGAASKTGTIILNASYLGGVAPISVSWSLTNIQGTGTFIASGNSMTISYTAPSFGYQATVWCAAFDAVGNSIAIPIQIHLN